MTRRKIGGGVAAVGVVVLLASPSWGSVRLGVQRLVEVRGGLGVNVVAPNSIAMRMGVEPKSLIRHIEVHYLDNNGDEKSDARDTNLILNYREPLRHKKIFRIILTWEQNKVQYTAKVRLVTYGDKSLTVPDDPNPDDFIAEH
jgi:hypothetical protein